MNKLDSAINALLRLKKKYTSGPHGGGSPSESTMNSIHDFYEVINTISDLRDSIKEKDKCFYCNEETDSLAANPNKWALRLPVDPKEPGRPKTVCTGCVLERLRIAEEHLREEKR